MKQSGGVDKREGGVGLREGGVVDDKGTVGLLPRDIYLFC